MRLALALLVVTGCGGLSPDFVGTWSGTVVVTITPAGLRPIINSNNMSHFVVTESAEGMVVPTCADQTGRLVFTGSGNHASYSGLQSCPAPVDNCPSASIVLRSGTATLEGTSRLLASISGTAALCGDSAPLTYEFNGTK